MPIYAAFLGSQFFADFATLQILPIVCLLSARHGHGHGCHGGFDATDAITLFRI